MRWLIYSFRVSVHYYKDEEHGGMQANLVLELRMLHIVGNRKSTDSLGNIPSIGNLKAHPAEIDFLQQGHSHNNKATSPNSITSYKIVRANYIRITKVLDSYIEKGK